MTVSTRLRRSHFTRSPDDPITRFLLTRSPDFCRPDHQFPYHSRLMVLVADEESDSPRAVCLFLPNLAIPVSAHFRIAASLGNKDQLVPSSIYRRVSKNANGDEDELLPALILS